MTIIILVLLLIVVIAVVAIEVSSRLVMGPFLPKAKETELLALLEDDTNRANKKIIFLPELHYVAVMPFAASSVYYWKELGSETVYQIPRWSQVHKAIVAKHAELLNKQ